MMLQRKESQTQFAKKTRFIFFNSFTKQGVLFKILTKGYLFDLEGIFYAFILPVFLEIVIYVIFKSFIPAGTKFEGSQIWGLVLLPIATTGLVGMPIMITSWKESILVKRLKVMPISKAELIFAFLFFNTIVALLGFCWAIMWAIVILKLDNNSQLFEQHLHWGYLILGGVLTSLISISIGLVISGRCSNQIMAQAVALSIYFPFCFLGGLMMPLYLIDNTLGMRIFTHLDPLKPGAFVNFFAWNDASLHITSPGTPFSMNYDEYGHIWQPIVASLGWTCLALVVTLSTFKLTNK